MATCNRPLAFAVSILLFGCVDFAQGQQDLPAEVLAYADTVFYNGKILAADDKFTVTDAVAVRDGKFLAVGDSARILRMAGPKTEKINLEGKTVIPGFIEVHSTNWEGMHGPSGPTWLGSTFLRFLELDAGLRAMKGVVEKAKPGEWVFFNVFRTTAAYQLSRRLLDSIAPNNAVLVTIDNTTGVVNSPALQKLPNIPGVEAGIIKDDKGEPTGMIRGWAYGVLTYEVLPWPEGQQFEAMVQNQKGTMQRLNSIGVTTMGGRSGGLSVSIAKTLYDRGELPVRIRIISEVPRLNPNTEGMLKRTGNLERVGDEWFKIVGSTVSSIDSNASNGGYLTRRPKLKQLPGDPHGLYGQNKWTEMVAKAYDWKEFSDYKSALVANRYGWSVSDLHIQGDGGVDAMLEVMEKADTENPIAGRRFGFVHGAMRAGDQLAKLARYHAELSFAPRYLFLDVDDELLSLQYGPDAVHRVSTIKSAIDAGLKPVLEANTSFTKILTFKERIDLTESSLAQKSYSEWAIAGGSLFDKYKSTYLLLVEKFITRKHEDTGKVWGQDERLTRQQALWMGTNWAAHMYGDEKELGSIEPGKLADLVILGEDYMTVAEDKISDIPILKAFVGGKVHYEKK